MKTQTKIKNNKWGSAYSAILSRRTLTRCLVEDRGVDPCAFFFFSSTVDRQRTTLHFAFDPRQKGQSNSERAGSMIRARAFASGRKVRWISGRMQCSRPYCTHKVLRTATTSLSKKRGQAPAIAPNCCSRFAPGRVDRARYFSLQRRARPFACVRGSSLVGLLVGGSLAVYELFPAPTR